MNQQTAPQKPLNKQHDEEILVVKRTELFPDDNAFHGLKQVNFTQIMSIIDHKKEFLPRSLMETDSSYKQIIPYLVFNYEDRYFLMQRDAQASETRLQSKYSLGIGGHIRETDIENNTVFEWAQREFHEEVHYNDDFIITPIGLLNDDTNDVGKVHIGFVLLLTGTTSAISVKSELKSGSLVTLETMEQYRDSMETWSQIVFDFLKSRNGP